MNKVDTRLLREIADLEGTPKGAYNIRKNGKLDSRSTTANIDIVTKEDKPGIDIHLRPAPNTESVHIPVLITERPGRAGLQRLFHRPGLRRGHRGRLRHPQRRPARSQHDGVHTFYVGKNSKVR